MATYNARVSAPDYSDPNYIHYSSGGNNYCIEISGGSVLPNCVGYAWGRWRELLGEYHNLPRSNAEDWYNSNHGYSKGQTPKLGAVACWRKGSEGYESDGAGHVAIVEDVNSDGSIVLSNSAYGGTRFYTSTMSAPYDLGGSYTFQGFIYLPTEYSGGSIINVNTSSGSEGESSSGGKNITGLSSLIQVKVSDIVIVLLCILLVVAGATLLVLGAKDTIIKEVL